MNSVLLFLAGLFFLHIPAREEVVWSDSYSQILRGEVKKGCYIAPRKAFSVLFDVDMEKRDGDEERRFPLAKLKYGEWDKCNLTLESLKVPVNPSLLD